MPARAGADVDIVVVGCGVAGAAAAVGALEAARDQYQHTGLRLLILERTGPEQRGGNSRWTSAYLRMEDLQRVATGFVEDLLAFSSGRSDGAYVEMLAGRAGETLAWVRTMGVDFDYLRTMFLTQARPRLLPVGGGRAVIDALLSRAEGLGAHIVYRTTAWRLSLDEEGTIDGLYVRGDDGRSALIRARAVVLASGGFEGNPEMLTQYVGQSAYRLRTIAEGGLHNKGEGIRMALEIGAKSAGQWDGFHAEPIDPRSEREEAVVMVYPYAILVDQDGRRFVDEGVTTVDEQYEAVARRIFTLPGHRAWLVGDQKLLEIPGRERAILTNVPPEQAETLEGLAELIRVPAKTLIETVRSFNAAVQPGPFDPFRKDGKRAWGIDPPKSNWAVEIDRPPFVAYPIECSIVFTFGGLATDTSARVLSADDYPIPGLYAAGEITGLYYGKYPGATSVLRGLVFGRIAGQQAVPHVLTPQTPLPAR